MTHNVPITPDLSSQLPRPQIHSPVLEVRNSDIVGGKHELFTIEVTREGRVDPIADRVRKDWNSVFSLELSLRMSLVRAARKRTHVSHQQDRFQTLVGALPVECQRIAIDLGQLESGVSVRLREHKGRWGEECPVFTQAGTARQGNHGSLQRSSSVRPRREAAYHRSLLSYGSQLMCYDKLRRQILTGPAQHQ